MKPKEFRIPKTLGACADLLYETRNKRLELGKQVAELEAQEGKLKAYLIDNLPKSEAQGITGSKARVTLNPKTIPTVENWDDFWSGFRKDRDRDLFIKRLNDAAVKERWDAGKEVPGVGKFETTSVSVTKI